MRTLFPETAKAPPNVIILSEVGKVTKLGKGTIAALLIFALSPVHSLAAANDGANGSITVKASKTGDELNDCNWLVTYRGRTYDLAPLTREALARPIETDLRYALQRVPESEAHLNKMSAKLKEARTHTILASVFITGFLATYLLRSRQKNDDRRGAYDPLLGATGGFFVAATFFSWKATRDAKSELVSAVDAFNSVSPNKIEPSTPQRREEQLLVP